MARKLIQYVEYTDDLDRESPSDETIELAVDGTMYELDLTTANAKELREFLLRYQEAAHDKWKVPASKKRKVTNLPALPPVSSESVTDQRDRDKRARKHVREWAQENGFSAASSGHIPIATLQAFRDANPKAYIPASTLRMITNG